MRPPVLLSEKGFGLVVALAAVLAVGILGTFALRDLSEALRQAGRARDEFKAYMLARSGVEWVRSVPLEGAEGDENGFWEIWSRLRRRGFRGGMISVNVVDESARLNLSTLLDKGDPKSKEVLRRLFNVVGLPEIRHAAILSSVPAEEGPEPDPSKSAKRAIFATVGEVKQLVGRAYAWELLAPHVTVVSNGKVDVNRAQREVLAALFPERGEAAAAAIISGRSLKPFSSISELTQSLEKSGVSTSGKTRSLLGTKSETVTAWSVGEFANQRQVVAATLRWHKGMWMIVAFRTSARFRNLEDKPEGF
ncbi:MAG: general secretion pathway protein GspK [Nitrospinota bacterium]